MIARNVISVREVLEAVHEFEHHQPDGVSSQLIAWELLVTELVVASATRLASARGLIECSGIDPRGRTLWRLTGSGRDRLATASSSASAAARTARGTLR